MTTSQKIRVRLSEVRERLNAIAALEGEAFTDEVRSEAEALHTEYADLEIRHRAAILAEPEPEEREAAPDAEMRERVELRSRASLGTYLAAALSGRVVSDGAEAELAKAAGVGEGKIPLELWDTAPRAERRQAEQRADAVSPAPGTVGVNLDRILPAIFAPSVAPSLGIDMPRVASGTYASATISTSLSADAKAKGGAAESTAAALTVTTATPKRVSARLSLTAEDIASVGHSGFEAALRENLSLVLSDELDDQALNGDGSAPSLSGIFKALTDPSAPAAGVAGFDTFVAAFAGGLDGLWASRMSDVGILAGVDTYSLSARTFRDATGQDLGSIAFADYAASKYGGWRTSKRMPATESHVQQAILRRMGRGGLRTAVCPHWGALSIDDIYTDSASATRHFTAHVLLGDVIVTQPGAYAQVAFRVSA